MRKIIQMALGLISVGGLLAAASFATHAADETCWKSSYARRVTVPGRCPPGTVMEAGLCYEVPRDGFGCTATACAVRDCPPGFGNRAGDCVRLGKVRVHSWIPGEAPGNQGAFDRCNQEWGGGCSKDQDLYGPGATTASMRNCPSGWTSTGGACWAPCPGGWASTPTTCVKPRYDRGAGFRPVCGPGQEEQAGLCYTPCRDGYAGVGIVCWSACPARLEGALPPAAECKGRLCDCGGMCGTSIAACAASGVNQGFAILQLVLQAIGLGGAISPFTKTADTALKAIGIAVSTAQGASNIGFNASIQQRAAAAKQIQQNVMNSTSSATAIAATTLATQLPGAGLRNWGGGLGVGFAANLGNFAAGAIADPSGVDTRAILQLDPIGIGAVAAAFMLPTCEPVDSPPFLSVVPFGPASTSADLRIITWEGVRTSLRTFQVDGYAGSAPSKEWLWMSADGAGEGGRQVAVGSPDGKVIRFRTWGGTNSAFLLTRQGVFVHVDGNAAGVTSRYIDFLGQDGKMWRARPLAAGVSFELQQLLVLEGPESLQASPAGRVFTDRFNYVGWDNALWFAERHGPKFVHQKRGGLRAHPDDIINYISWDNQYWTARWEGDQFRHVRRGTTQTHTSRLLTTFDWSTGQVGVAWDPTYGKFELINPENKSGVIRLAALGYSGALPAGAPRAPIVAPLQAGEFYADYLQYVSWDKSQWSLRRAGDTWTHTPRGAGPTHESRNANYLTWDGSPWSAELVNEGISFKHSSPDGKQQHVSGSINFADWGSKNWTARWDPIGGKFIAKAGPAALAQAPNPAYAGRLIKATDSVSVYFVNAQGLRMKITSADVFTACGFDWKNVENLPPAPVNAIFEGATLSTADGCRAARFAGRPIKSPDSPFVYLVSQSGQRQQIADPAVFTGCGLDWKAVETLPAAIVNAFPAGQQLATAQACVAAKSPR